MCISERHRQAESRSTVRLDALAEARTTRGQGHSASGNASVKVPDLVQSGGAVSDARMRASAPGGVGSGPCSGGQQTVNLPRKAIRRFESCPLRPRLWTRASPAAPRRQPIDTVLRYRPVPPGAPETEAHNGSARQRRCPARSIWFATGTRSGPRVGGSRVKLTFRCPRRVVVRWARSPSS